MIMTTNMSLTQCVSEKAFWGNVRSTIWTFIGYKWTAHLPIMSFLEFLGRHHCIPRMQSLSLMTVPLPPTPSPEGRKAEAQGQARREISSVQGVFVLCSARLMTGKA